MAQKVPGIAPSAYSHNELKVQCSVEEWLTLPLYEKLAKLPIRHFAINGGGQPGITIKTQMPRLYLVSGHSLSMQANEHAYCTPRNNEGPYVEVEVGFVDGPVPDSWLPYAEEANRLNETVFGYIPLELVMFYIGANGGIDNQRSFGLLKSWDLLLK